MVVETNLIFDIGMHQGLDANFYLAKGFKVVGLEASPMMCEASRQRNIDFLDGERLTIVERALYSRSGETVSFFVNPEKDDWGSLYRYAAEQGVGRAEEIHVQTITLPELIERYGVPYYAKCDIEGGDAIFADQLLQLNEKPTFVSLEVTQLQDVARLLACGYDRFQVVNQYLNPQTRPPNPALEGNFKEVWFTHHMSGLFGKELPPQNWRDYETIMPILANWIAVNRNYGSISVGWLDVHACRTGTASGIG